MPEGTAPGLRGRGLPCLPCPSSPRGYSHTPVQPPKHELLPGQQGPRQPQGLVAGAQYTLQHTGRGARSPAPPTCATPPCRPDPLSPWRWCNLPAGPLWGRTWGCPEQLQTKTLSEGAACVTWTNPKFIFPYSSLTPTLTLSSTASFPPGAERPPSLHKRPLCASLQLQSLTAPLCPLRRTTYSLTPKVPERA